MKITFCALFLSFTCFAQTNIVHKIPVAAQLPPPLPADVAQADAKVHQLRISLKNLSIAASALSLKQLQRMQAHLPPASDVAMMMAQNQRQQTLLRQQLIVAERWDYQIRDFHHLGPLGAK